MSRRIPTILAALSCAGLVACASGRDGGGGAPSGGGSTSEVETTASTDRPTSGTGTVPAGSPRHQYAVKLPLFALEDPRGDRHDEQSLLQRGEGVVLLVTTPTMATGDDQEEWSRALESTAPPGSRWVLIQDLSQTWMKGQAEKRLAEEFDPTQPPLILLDRDGSFRKALGVEEGKSVLLAYDEEGKLVRFEAGRPDPEAARRAWTAAKQQQQQ